jgi:hypothetical protein
LLAKKESPQTDIFDYQSKEIYKVKETSNINLGFRVTFPLTEAARRQQFEVRACGRVIEKKKEKKRERE